MSIGLQNPDNTELQGGPAVFTARLKSQLVAQGRYSEEDFDTWMNLAFRPVPQGVMVRRPRLVMRFDGTWNMAAWPFWGRQPGPLSPINTWVYRRLNRRLMDNIRIAHAFVFQSEFSRKMVERLCGSLPDKETKIIFNGVDLRRFSPRSPGRKLDGSLRILVSHKHWGVKRSWGIPDIIARLASSGGPPSFVRVLGGDTPNPIPGIPSPLERMKQNIRRLDVGDHFEFIGHVPPEELPNHYRWADLMINLSFADPCPNVVVEALASGLPVIGPATGGLAELVDQPDWAVNSGEDAFALYNPYIYRTFPKIDVDAYVATVMAVIQDLPAHGGRARKRAEDALNIHDVVEAYLEVLGGGRA